jgi:hypothetical protein
MRDLKEGYIPPYARHILYYHQFEVFIKLSFANKPLFQNL